MRASIHTTADLNKVIFSCPLLVLCLSKCAIMWKTMGRVMRKKMTRIGTTKPFASVDCFTNWNGEMEMEEMRILQMRMVWHVTYDLSSRLICCTNKMSKIACYLILIETSLKKLIRGLYIYHLSNAIFSGKGVGGGEGGIQNEVVQLILWSGPRLCACGNVQTSFQLQMVASMIAAPHPTTRAITKAFVTNRIKTIWIISLNVRLVVCTWCSANSS